MVLHGELFGQQTRNTLYYQYTDVNPSPLPIDSDELMTALTTIIFPDLFACVSNEWFLREVRFRLLDATFPFFSVTPFSNQGLLIAVACPPSVTANTQRNRGIIGRTNRQRTYWAGIPISSVDQGRITNLAIANWQSFAAKLVQDLPTPTVGQNFQPCICDLTVPGDATNIRLLTVATVDPILRSQRRREIGVGI